MEKTITPEELTKVNSLPVQWNGGFCDHCRVMAVYSASKDGMELNFCGHHVRKHAAKLVKQGFTIQPDNYLFS
jgi:hypothetical protein